MPRVTAIIPTFNFSSVLPYSIGSVLRQTFTDFELLVIGDGCTDDSENVVHGIGDPRIRWINLPTNSGHQSAVNNEGLRQARGELIAYLGHDDLWLPHHLAVLVAAADAGADMSYGITEQVPPDGGRPVPAPDRLGDYVHGLWIPPSGVLHRRQAALDVGGWPLFGEVDCDPELALWERMHAAGYKIVFVPRLVAVKFPAAWRRDIYKNRTVDQQAAWSRRIVEESNLECVELVNLLSAQVGVSLPSKPFKQVMKEFGLDTWQRVRRRVFGRRPPKLPTRTEIFNTRRKFKGLDPKAPPGNPHESY